MEHRQLHVLLLSPVPGLDPPNGDVTYTTELLREPPPGVVYTRYDDALRGGLIRERARRADGASLRDIGSSLLLAREAAINRLRSRELLFREPFRHFAVTPNAFDLVHSHVFAVRLSGAAPPLVISNSIEIDALYRDALGRNAATTALKRHADRALAAATGVSHASYGHRGATRVVCFSDDLRDRFVARDPTRGSRYVVVPPSVVPLAATDLPERSPFTVGFIGDWAAKGGRVVLDAHRQLRQRGVDSRLIVVGSAPRLSADESDSLGVEWFPRLPRKVLLETVVPRLSAFAYPSAFDGLPLTLLEVMSAGVPAVVSEYGALPEVVDHGLAGLVVPRADHHALAVALTRLLDRGERARLGAAGRQRVQDRYGSGRNGQLLRAVYDAAADAH